MGKLCRDTRGPSSQPKYPVPTSKPYRDAKLLSRRGTKNLCHDKESLRRYTDCPACLGTLSRYGDPCRNTGPRSSVARMLRCHMHACLSHERMPIARAHAFSTRPFLSRTPKLGHASCLRTLSLPRIIPPWPNCVSTSNTIATHGQSRQRRTSSRPRPSGQFVGLVGCTA